MPPRATSEKIVSLFQEIFRNEEEKSQCCQALAAIIEKTTIDGDRISFRYQVFKKLVRITKETEELKQLIRHHDRILNGVECESEEDITGYHHSYSPKKLYYWISICQSAKELLAIVTSSVPESVARKIKEKHAGAIPS